MAADLHCHTKLSDGSVGIEDLIVIAQKSGIDTIAITDHDCNAGTVRGQVIGKRYGVTVIPGVELSAFDSEAGKQVHVFSYLADKPDRLEGLCKRTSVARKRAGQIMMLKVASLFPISTDFIISHASGSTNLYKQHIMHSLVDAGYTTELFGELYDALAGIDRIDLVGCEAGKALAAVIIGIARQRDEVDILVPHIVGDDHDGIGHPVIHAERKDIYALLALEHLVEGGSFVDGYGVHLL